MHELQRLAGKFNPSSAPICARRMSGGQVHDSYLVDLADGSSLVLQRLNTKIYPDTAMLVSNTTAVSHFIEQGAEPGSRRFIRYLTAGEDKQSLVEDKKGALWRAYSYIDRAHTPLPDESTAHDASELAKALGLFYRQLADFPVASLGMVFPDYHNTPKLFADFRALVEAAPKSLIDSAREEIGYALKQERYTGALLKMELPARVTHNEARLRNLLLDNETGRAVCLIDYDTVMPGLMAFDFGTAVRSACRIGRGDERQMSRVKFDIDRYADFTRLFLDVVRPLLDKNEMASLAGGCIVMALEAGIKYLTDYMTGNLLYRAAYPEQNLYRARVQLMLCIQMQYYYKEMENIVRRCL